MTKKPARSGGFFLVFPAWIALRFACKFSALLPERITVMLHSELPAKYRLVDESEEMSPLGRAIATVLQELASVEIARALLPQGTGGRQELNRLYASLQYDLAVLLA